MTDRLFQGAISFSGGSFCTSPNRRDKIDGYINFISTCSSATILTFTPAMARKSGGNTALISLLLLLAVGAAVYWVWRQYGRGSGSDADTVFARYPGFAISLPQGYAIHGIDVSRYQHQINWKLVQQMESRDVRLGFAFIKATEGTSLVDKQFKRNWKRSREAGIPRGAYHFFRADRDAAAQARHFISTVQLLPGDLPPVLDVESLYKVSAAEMQDKVALWLHLVEQHYQMKPILYTGADFYSRYLHPRFADYPLWVAHYNEPRQPRVRRDWTFWQHSERGRVNGINALVDFNVFQGDSTAFNALLKGGNPAQKTQRRRSR